MTYVLVLIMAYSSVTIPGYAKQDVCRSAGEIAMAAKNSRIVSYACVPLE